MNAAFAALAGALIGVIGTLGTTWLQQRQQSVRDLLKAATELGMRDFQHSVELAAKRGGGSLPPLSLFVAYHAEVLRALAIDDFGPEAVRRIDRKQRDTLDAIANRDASSTER